METKFFQDTEEWKDENKVLRLFAKACQLAVIYFAFTRFVLLYSKTSYSCNSEGELLRATTK